MSNHRAERAATQSVDGSRTETPTGRAAELPEETAPTSRRAARDLDAVLARGESLPLDLDIVVVQEPCDVDAGSASGTEPGAASPAGRSLQDHLDLARRVFLVAPGGRGDASCETSAVPPGSSTPARPYDGVFAVDPWKATTSRYVRSPELLPPQLRQRLGGRWVLIIGADERWSSQLRDSLCEWLAPRSSTASAFDAVAHERIDVAKSADAVEVADTVKVTVTRFVCGRYLRHGGWRSREPRLVWFAAADAGSRRQSGPTGPGRAEAPGAGLGEGTAPPAPELLSPGVLVQLGHRHIGDRLRSIQCRSTAFSRRPEIADSVLGGRRLLFACCRRFLWRFVRKTGFRDGVAGLVAAALDAFELFLCHVKAAERSGGH